ncbi:hypothetical protein ACTFIW_013000 [Dictyostelium discoideum]
MFKLSSNDINNKLEKLGSEDIGSSSSSFNNSNNNNNEDCVKKYTSPIKVIGVQGNSCIGFSPDDSRFAFVSGNGSIYIAKDMKNDSFEIENVLTGHSHSVDCLLFHPKEPILVSGGFDGIFIWDYLKGFIIKKVLTHKDIDSHDSKVEALAWLYNGTSLVTGSKDSTIKIWDFMEQGYPLLETITAHKAPVTCFSVNNESNILASAGRDSSVKVWDISTLRPEFRSKRSDDSSIKVAIQSTLEGHMGDVVSMYFSRDGSMLFSGARDNEIKVWSIKEQSEIRSIKQHKGDVTCLKLLGKDQSILMTSSIDGTVKSIRLGKIKSLIGNDVLQIEELTKEAQIIESQAISGNIHINSISDINDPNAGEYLDIGLGSGSGGDNGVGSDKDKVLFSFELHDGIGIGTMTFSNSLKLMATSADRSIRIWRLPTSNYSDKPILIHEFVGHRGPVNSVQILPNSNSILSGSTDYNVFLYNLNTMKREMVFNFEGSVYTMCVGSKNNQTVVFVGGNHYDIKGYLINQNDENNNNNNNNNNNQLPIVQFNGHSGKVQTIAINPDCTMLVSGGNDFDILVWQIKMPYVYRGGDEFNQLQKPINKQSFHKGHITGLSFSDNGKYLISSSTDHSIVLWTVNSNGKKINREITIENAHNSVVSAISFGHGQISSQFFYSGSWEGSIRVFDTSNLKKCSKSIHEFKAHNSRLSSLTVSSDGSILIASFSDGIIKTFSSVRPWSPIAIYSPNESTSCNALSSNFSFFVSGSDNGLIRCWPTGNEQIN